MENENLIIHGDCHDAMDLLSDEIHGKVKCIYIDPPYNTGKVFREYLDNLGEDWLGWMGGVLTKLKPFLREDGTIWVSIGHSEVHYLKVLGDAIFGRGNFVRDIAVGVRSGGSSHTITAQHEHILVWAKRKKGVKFNRIRRTASTNARYSKVDPDGRRWRWMDVSTPKLNSSKVVHSVAHPETGKLYQVSGSREWKFKRNKMERLARDGQLKWLNDGTVRSVKSYLDKQPDRAIPSMWPSVEIGTNGGASTRLKTLIGRTFSTTKPERLLSRVIHCATDKGDLVMDLFGGSGTTGAVAHKMGRSFVMVELGDQINTIIIPRLRAIGAEFEIIEL